jgi:formate dehydrogenase iron-sulfur subunit
MSKGFFIDLSKCTACRGCQVACKQWKKLPAEKTSNWGSHQNPKDLSYNTLKLVHFQEIEVDGKLDYVFFPEQCRHCLSAPCVVQSSVDGAMIQDEATGAVYYTDKTKDCKYADVLDSCPYKIPRLDEKTKRISKCDMCIDRVQNGKLPACVLTCPTGAMNFGALDEMLAMAKKRLEEVKKTHPKAVLGDPDDVRVIYLFPVDPKLYHANAVASHEPSLMTRKQLLAKAANPIKRLFS